MRLRSRRAALAALAAQAGAAAGVCLSNVSSGHIWRLGDLLGVVLFPLTSAFGVLITLGPNLLLALALTASYLLRRSHFVLALAMLSLGFLLSIWWTYSAWRAR